MPNTSGQLVVLSSRQPPQVMTKSARKRARLAASQSGRTIVVASSGSGKKTKSKRKSNASLDSGASGMNPYLETILDAEEVRGIKLPDPITFPSSTYCFEQDGTVQTDASGQFVVFVNPANITNSGSSAFANSVVVATNTGASGSAAGFGTTALPLANPASNPAVTATIGQIRIVSGKVKAYSLASPLNTSGRMIGFAVPRNQGGIGPLTAVGILGLPYSYGDHAVKGGEARYIPTDNVEHEYAPTSGGAIYNGNSPTTGGNTGSLLGVGALSGGFGVAGVGLPTNGMVAYRVVVNYEFLPATDALDFVNRQPSPDRPDWMSSVNNFVAKWGERLLMPAMDLLGTAANVVLPGLGSLATGAIRGAMPTMLKELNRKNEIRSTNIGALSPARYGQLPY